MNTEKGSLPNNGVIVFFLVILNGIVLSEAYTSRREWYLALVFTVPLLLLSMLGKWKKKHTIQSNPYQSSNLEKSISKRKTAKSLSEVQM